LKNIHQDLNDRGFQAHLEVLRFLLVSRPMAKHFSELTCWQLARSLKKEVNKILKKPVFQSHHRFRDNLSDAASSDQLDTLRRPLFRVFLDFNGGVRLAA
jgi:hypothetical protein